MGLFQSQIIFAPRKAHNESMKRGKNASMGKNSTDCLPSIHN